MLYITQLFIPISFVGHILYFDQIISQLILYMFQHLSLYIYIKTRLYFVYLCMNWTLTPFPFLNHRAIQCKFVVIEQSHDPHPYNTIIYSTSFVKHILLLRIIFFKSFHNQFSIRSTKAKSTTHTYATQLFIPFPSFFYIDQIISQSYP